MKKLIAQIPILYHGRMYAVGETLPAYEPQMVDAWLRAGSAKLTETVHSPCDINFSMIKPITESLNPQVGEESPEAQQGNPVPVNLNEMSKDELKALAKKMGVELPRGATVDLIISKLTAATAAAPENDGDIQ